MDILNCTPQLFVENEEAVLQQLQDPKIWEKIPLLNANELHNLRDKTLVRFYGMIQDMYSPEYYLEKYEVVNKKTNVKTMRNGKYFDAVMSGDDEEVDLDSESNVTSERQTYVVITVPGINQWVNDIESEKYKISSTSTSVASSSKRSHEETMDSEEVTTQNHGAEDNSEKKSCTSNEDSSENQNPSIVSTEHILNFPLPNRNGKTCHLKVYKNSEGLKLNDICEFVGFLTLDPIFESFYQDDDTENKMEIETHHPPSSLVPRIHCITFKTLRHNNPLVSEDTMMDEGHIKFIFKELLIVLTQLMLGDELAAEYLIYHLISEIYLRRDFMPLGKFSLNILNIPKLEDFDYPCEIYKFVEILMPKSHYLPMTLENMNDLSFTPKKDYECDRLTSGILQLSANTHVLLDETKLSTGKLNAAGVISVRAIADVIKYQKLAYDFNYYPIEYDCDIPFLIFSEGKSMLTTDTSIILQADQTCVETFKEILEAARHFLNPELLKEIRIYLTIVRMAKYNISESVQNLVQQEFVNMRQNGSVSADDLHSLLVLARLVCVARGKNSLDDECWKIACELEKKRKSRVPK